MDFREKDPLDVAADALRMADRKQAEGCAPCAASYRLLARRSLLRAGGLAFGALAVSLADIPAAAGAAPGRARADATPIDAHALSVRLSGHAAVRQLKAMVGQTRSTAAFRGTTAAWSLLIEETAAGRILSVLEARGQVHAGAIVDDTAYVVQGGRVVVSSAATARWREVRHAGASTLATLSGLVRPLPAEAACPICPALMGACVLAVAACAADCPACCAAAVGICALAFNCCFNQ